uniref:Uncharacterized protein n=1 Tax=Rhizophora mucronata TaxID=61149 RepID=A0A2P2PYF1_RHIMU
MEYLTCQPCTFFFLFNVQSVCNRK